MATTGQKQQQLPDTGVRSPGRLHSPLLLLLALLFTEIQTEIKKEEIQKKYMATDTGVRTPGWQHSLSFSSSSNYSPNTDQKYTNTQTQMHTHADIDTDINTDTTSPTWIKSFS